MNLNPSQEISEDGILTTAVDFCEEHEKDQLVYLKKYSIRKQIEHDDLMDKQAAIQAEMSRIANQNWYMQKIKETSTVALGTVGIWYGRKFDDPACVNWGFKLIGVGAINAGCNHFIQSDNSLLVEGSNMLRAGTIAAAIANLILAGNVNKNMMDLVSAYFTSAEVRSAYNNYRLKKKKLDLQSEKSKEQWHNEASRNQTEATMASKTHELQREVANEEDLNNRAKKEILKGA